MNGLLEMLAFSFTIGLTGALAPGPTLVATVNSSVKDGWTSGPKVVAGHALLEFILFLLIVGGISVAVQSYERYIAVVGGVALILFGMLTLKGSGSASMNGLKGDVAYNPFLAGVVTSAANPYFWIWWLSIGSALVLEGLRAGLLVASIFMVGHWGADFGWYTLVSASIDRGRSVLSENSYRRVLEVCGAFLILFGVYYLATGSVLR